MEILLIISGIAAALFYFWYMALVTRRNKALEALSGIDVHYNMRFDLIPNVLKIAQKFMDHEKSLLTEITALRTEAQKNYDKKDAGDVSKHLQAVEALSAKMGQFMVSVEAYPDLKSDQTMVQAMQTYNEVEAQIAAARRFYNAAVTALNNSVQIFPGNIVAGFANVKEMPFFAAAESVKSAVNASDYLK